MLYRTLGICRALDLGLFLGKFVGTEHFDLEEFEVVMDDD